MPENLVTTAVTGPTPNDYPYYTGNASFCCISSTRNHNTSAYLALTYLVVRTRLFVLRLVEKEVGSEFFILITSKISLDSCISVESEAAKLSRISNEYDLIKLESYPLDSVTLLLSNGNSLSSRRQRNVVVGVLAEELEKLIGI
jgi:hypothetical protein